jgi:regulatory protein
MPGPKPSLKARALRYLAAREHSRQELARKLARYAEASDDIPALLAWLEASKFLSESRFAESLVNRRVARYGNSRILSELQRHGLDETAVVGLRQTLGLEEDQRAWEVWRKKFGKPAESAADKAKQMRFLQQRGFSSSAISAVMRKTKHHDSESQ